MAIVVDRETRLVVQGITGREGSFHATRNLRYGTNVVAGVTPGEGRRGRRGDPGLRHRARGSRRDRVRTPPWSSSPRASPPTRSTRRSTRASRRSSASPRACPPTTCSASTTTCGPRGVTLVGPNCPGVLSPGKANVGIIPAEIFSEGPVGLVSQIRHAHVPDRPRADTARYRPVDYRRNRGGPRGRVVVHRRARHASRPIPRPRSSSWSARSAGRRRRRPPSSSPTEMTQARRRLHRRLHGAAGQDHGPRRRDHLRLRGHGAARRSKRSRRTASAWGRTPPKPRASPPKPSAPEPPSCS